MEISGFVSMSHAPQWDLRFDEGGPAGAYIAGVLDGRRRVAALRPDVVIVFGPDHLRNFFYDTMPPFCIGVEAVEAFGDYGAAKGLLPGAPELGRFVVEHLLDQDFDPALSLHMGIDHGISQPYSALVGEGGTPILPIMINCTGAGMPSVRRCFKFGQEVGRAVRACPMAGRAVVVGSGGLSHSPPSASPFDPALPDARRDYAIHGRKRVQDHNAAMEALLAHNRETGVTGPINEQWDEWFLSQLASGDLEPLLELTSAEILEKAGVGGQEVRTWLAAIGAWGGVVEASSYAPVPTWITGMGCVAASAQ